MAGTPASPALNFVEPLRGKQQAMFGSIYIAAPQLLFNRLPWLLGHTAPSTRAGLLRQVARAVLCAVVLYHKVSYRIPSYRHTVTPHTIISRIWSICHISYRHTVTLLIIIPHIVRGFGTLEKFRSVFGCYGYTSATNSIMLS